jgi:hypothetical protein
VKLGGGAPAEGRGALLSSIAGFSKGGLKKATTVDKSAPIISTISLFLPPPPLSLSLAVSSPPTFAPSSRGLSSSSSRTPSTSTGIIG